MPTATAMFAPCPLMTCRPCRTGAVEGGLERMLRTYHLPTVAWLARRLRRIAYSIAPSLPNVCRICNAHSVRSLPLLRSMTKRAGLPANGHGVPTWRRWRTRRPPMMHTLQKQRVRLILLTIRYHACTLRLRPGARDASEGEGLRRALPVSRSRILLYYGSSRLRTRAAPWFGAHWIVRHTDSRRSDGHFTPQVGGGVNPSGIPLDSKRRGTPPHQGSDWGRGLAYRWAT